MLGFRVRGLGCGFFWVCVRVWGFGALSGFLKLCKDW